MYRRSLQHRFDFWKHRSTIATFTQNRSDFYKLIVHNMWSRSNFSFRCVHLAVHCSSLSQIQHFSNPWSNLQQFTETSRSRSKELIIYPRICISGLFSTIIKYGILLHFVHWFEFIGSLLFSRNDWRILFVSRF